MTRIARWKTTSVTCFVMAFAGLSGIGSTSAAQGQAELVEAFSGEWFIFDEAARAGTQPCQLTLDSTPIDGPIVSIGADQLHVSARSCAAPFSEIESWSIEGAQLVFYSPEGARIGDLGGNQQRITGELADGRGIIVERLSGDSGTQALAQALQRHRCFFQGLTQTCATSENLQVPDPANAENGLSQVEVLAALAVRRQPRRDSTTMGTVPANVCLNVNQCLVASDGVWCRARFGDTSGWVARNALRQEEWPVITFLPTCSDDDQ